jgi:hypothetical protein
MVLLRDTVLAASIQVIGEGSNREIVADGPRFDDAVTPARHTP